MKEDRQMFARKTVVFRRAIALATVAALALTVVVPTVATAAERGKAAVTSGMTDISARRRLGPGAAAAAFAGIVGTGLAIAAAQNRAAYYDEYYGGGYYGGGPVYVAPAPGYYGGGYGYYDPSYGPGPYGYGTTVPYVNGHPIADW
jgi:hypothetical protein